MIVKIKTYPDAGSTKTEVEIDDTQLVSFIHLLRRTDATAAMEATDRAMAQSVDHLLSQKRRGDD